MNKYVRRWLVLVVVLFALGWVMSHDGVPDSFSCRPDPVHEDCEGGASAATAAPLAGEGQHPLP